VAFVHVAVHEHVDVEPGAQSLKAARVELAPAREVQPRHRPPDLARPGHGGVALGDVRDHAGDAIVTVPIEWGNRDPRACDRPHRQPEPHEPDQEQVPHVYIG
jgi:hypothetical protein